MSELLTIRPIRWKLGWSKPLKLTKTLKISIMEVGMLGGIALAGYTLPANTPLRTFVIASVVVLLVGNVLIIRSVRARSNAATAERGFWPRILRVIAILAILWLFVAVLGRI
jgi:energy-converting hydrogenase Eha subunit C